MSFLITVKPGMCPITLVRLLDDPSGITVGGGGQENNGVCIGSQTLCNLLDVLPRRRLFYLSIDAPYVTSKLSGLMSFSR